ncbi:MAG: methyltransferase family protein [Chthoniobacterales bacterium]
MSIAVVTNPENGCYAVWSMWALSWFLAAVWSSRAESRASIARQLPYRLLTLAGFFLLFAVNTRRSHSPLRLWKLPYGAGWAMVLLCLVGFGFAWWARLHLGRLWSAFVTRKADHRIVDTGPYAIVRHPIYTGIILAAIATAIIKGTVFAIAGAALATLGFWIKARLEEGFLRAQLGAEAYDAYRRRVPMLVPFWSA